VETLTLRTPAYGADYRERAAYLNAEHPLASCATCGGTRQYVAAAHPMSGCALATQCSRCKLEILPVGSSDGAYTWHVAWTDRRHVYEYITRMVRRNVQVERVDAGKLVARYLVPASGKCRCRTVRPVSLALAQAHRERAAG